MIHGDPTPHITLIAFELLQSFEYQTLRSILIGMFVSNDMYLKELFMDGYNNPLKSLIPFTGETKGVGRQLTNMIEWRLSKPVVAGYPLGIIGEAYILFGSLAPISIYFFFCFFICFLKVFDDKILSNVVF